MTTPVFTWVYSYGVQIEVTPRVLEAKFGDGYSMRAEDGLNTVPEEWSVSFDNLEDIDANDIMTFLRAQKGVYPFLWTNPEGVQRLYICKTFSRSQDDEDHNAVKAKFSYVPA